MTSPKQRTAAQFLISMGVYCIGIFFLIGVVLGYLLWGTDLGKPMYTYNPDNASKIKLVKVGLSKDALINLLGKPDEVQRRADTIHESLSLASRGELVQKVLVRANKNWVESNGSATEVWDYNVGESNGYSVRINDSGVCGNPIGYFVTF